MTSSTLTAVGSWTGLPALPKAAAWFGQHDNAVALGTTDTVLVLGGSGVVEGTSTALNQALRYHVTGDTWETAGTVSTPRRLHALTVLADGRVLASGGISGAADTGPALGSAEVYDPATNTWTGVDAMTTPRWGHSSVLLPDGRVLVAGGSTVRAGQSVKALRSAEVFHPDGHWEPVADMTDARTGHPAVVLQGGKVLVCGGASPVGGPDDAALAFCELFDPDHGWTPLPSMLQPRRHHQVTALSATRVLVTGGAPPGAPGDGTFDPFSRRTAEIFDLDAGMWSAAPDMPSGRSLHRAVALGPGKVLVLGGTGGGADEAGFRSAVLFDQAAPSGWSTVSGLATGRWAFAAVPLSGRRVLVTGGVTRSGLAAADPAIADLTPASELFTPGGGS
jgi:hypothetical protein